MQGRAGLHSPGPLSERAAGSKPPTASTCYTDLGEALLPDHHARRLQVKHILLCPLIVVEEIKKPLVLFVFFFLLFPLQDVFVFGATTHVLGRQNGHAVATRLPSTRQGSSFKF